MRHGTTYKAGMPVGMRHGGTHEARHHIQGRQASRYESWRYGRRVAGASGSSSNSGTVHAMAVATRYA